MSDTDLNLLINKFMQSSENLGQLNKQLEGFQDILNRFNRHLDPVTRLANVLDEDTLSKSLSLIEEKGSDVMKSLGEQSGRVADQLGLLSEKLEETLSRQQEMGRAVDDRMRQAKNDLGKIRDSYQGFWDSLKVNLKEVQENQIKLQEFLDEYAKREVENAGKLEKHKKDILSMQQQHLEAIWEMIIRQQTNSENQHKQVKKQVKTYLENVSRHQQETDERLQIYFNAFYSRQDSILEKLDMLNTAHKNNLSLLDVVEDNQHVLDKRLKKVLEKWGREHLKKQAFKKNYRYSYLGRKMAFVLLIIASLMVNVDFLYNRGEVFTKIVNRTALMYHIWFDSRPGSQLKSGKQ